MACAAVLSIPVGHATAQQRQPITLYQRPDRVNIPPGQELYSCYWYSASVSVGLAVAPLHGDCACSRVDPEERFRLGQDGSDRLLARSTRQLSSDYQRSKSTNIL